MTTSYLIECSCCKATMVYVGNDGLLDKFLKRNDACRCRDNSNLKATPGTLK